MPFEIGHFGKTPLSHRFVVLNIDGRSHYIRRFELRGHAVPNRTVPIRQDRQALSTLTPGGRTLTEGRLSQLGITRSGIGLTVNPAVFVSALITLDVGELLQVRLRSQSVPQRATHGFLAKQILARLVFPEDVPLVTEISYVDEKVVGICAQILRVETNPHIALARLVKKIYPFSEEGNVHIEGRKRFIERCASVLYPKDEARQASFVTKVNTAMFFPDGNSSFSLSREAAKLIGS